MTRPVTRLPENSQAASVASRPVASALRTRTMLVSAIVVILLGGAGAWLFFRGATPDAVSLDAAVEGVDASEAPSPDASGIDGEWSIDTESGDVTFEESTGSFAGFRIREELASVGSTTAVGRTRGVTGGITIDGSTVTAAGFNVDLRTITTNESRRDDQVQRALETSRFPTATFVLAEAIDLGAGATEGATVKTTAKGNLTLHGVTKGIEMPLEARLVGDTIVVVGSIDVTFADYGVNVPSSRVVLSVEDHGILELQFLLTR